MRRALAAFTAVLLLHSAALRTGVLCERARTADPVALPEADVAQEVGHSHHSAPPNAPPQRGSHEHGSPAHGSPAHCAWMAACSAASLAAPAGQAAARAAVLTTAPVSRQLAPLSFSSTPEPPPPKA